MNRGVVLLATLLALSGCGWRLTETGWYYVPPGTTDVVCSPSSCVRVPPPDAPILLPDVLTLPER